MNHNNGNNNPFINDSLRVVYIDYPVFVQVRFHEFYISEPNEQKQKIERKNFGLKINVRIYGDNKLIDDNDIIEQAKRMARENIEKLNQEYQEKLNIKENIHSDIIYTILHDEVHLEAVKEFAEEKYYLKGYRYGKHNTKKGASFGIFLLIALLFILILTVAKNPIPISQTDYRYVGSLNSNIYHALYCEWAKRISPENEIWFISEDDAINHGYRACYVCKP